MSSKTKNIVLIGAIFLVLFLCYQFAISNTLRLKNEHNVLQTEQKLLENAPEKMGILTQKKIYYDSILNKMNLGNTSIENNLLRVITLEVEKNNLKLIDFNDPHTFEINSSQLNTFDFTLEGDFTALVKTIYVLEQKHTFGEVVHLNFEKKKNYRTNKNYLTARVFIQNIE
ncbi:hypothetical protein [Maribacter sp. 2308TA10-17]|uniref:hypothetical protein n=1 Tax=Maribacter sp. 2308TA10-17 TaxID=3386276 RepID=UPI0039BCAA6F